MNAVDWLFVAAFLVMAYMAEYYRGNRDWWMGEAIRQYEWIDEITEELEKSNEHAN